MIGLIKEKEVVATAAPKTYLVEEPVVKLPPASHWLWVACLIGVDYFSTLAYQVSISFRAAGLLAPWATLVVVAMTLCAALPVYLYLAGRSPNGQSSIALLEQSVRGWKGKTLVLLLLGFAATDFVITKTLSTAAAAQHVIHNPSPAWQSAVEWCAGWARRLVSDEFGPAAGSHVATQMVVTLLLGGLSFLFWALIHRGFHRKAKIGAGIVVTAYLSLNAVIIASGLRYLYLHPEVVEAWHAAVAAGQWQIARPLVSGSGLWVAAAMCLVLFPKLCLGLSGLEMSIVAMPEVKGSPGEDPRRPLGRIRNTRKVIALAATVMSIYLIGSVLVSTLLIPPAEFHAVTGKAADRALAYLAHGGPLASGDPASALNPWFGPTFGSLYDIVTVLILCLAGTSVITGLTTLLPQFLLKFGMQLRWVHSWGLLFGVFALVNVLVTLIFHASVDDQRGAYATGVLVMISNAAVITVADRWSRRRAQSLWHFPWVFAAIAGLFILTTLAVIVTHPSGILIALVFIVVILASSILSRALRSHELRTLGIEFEDDESRLVWEQLKQFDVPVLVPHRPGLISRQDRAVSLRKEHQLAPDVKLVFIEVHVDDPSNFYQRLRMRVSSEDHCHVVQLHGCVSVAHTIAAVALELSQIGCLPALHFGWSEMGLLEESWRFLAFGEGNVPWKVRELIRLAEPNLARQPRVIIG